MALIQCCQCNVVHPCRLSWSHTPGDQGIISLRNDLPRIGEVPRCLERGVNMQVPREKYYLYTSDIISLPFYSLLSLILEDKPLTLTILCRQSDENKRDLPCKTSLHKETPRYTCHHHSIASHSPPLLSRPWISRPRNESSSRR
jgi:hypothetical protein